VDYGSQGVAGEGEELTRQRDAVSAERRQLPWVKVDKEYVRCAWGKKRWPIFSRAEQLIVYHFMFGPDWKEAARAARSTWITRTRRWCTGAARCDVRRDFAGDIAADRSVQEAHGMALCVGVIDRMTSTGYHVSFTKEEKANGKMYYNYEVQAFRAKRAGISVFYKDKDGTIFHTYSAYARGTEMTMSTYNYLDYVPKGRDEDGCVHDGLDRHHDRTRMQVGRQRYAVLAG